MKPSSSRQHSEGRYYPRIKVCGNEEVEDINWLWDILTTEKSLSVTVVAHSYCRHSQGNYPNVYQCQNSRYAQ